MPQSTAQAFQETPLIIEAAICPFRLGEPVWDAAGQIDEASACFAAGAAIVHYHHDFRLDAAGSLAEMSQVAAGAMAAYPGGLMYPDFIRADTLEGKLAHLPAMLEAGLLGMVAVDPGRANSVQLDDDGLPYGSNLVHSTFDEANAIAKLAAPYGTPLTIGVFEPFNLRWALAWHDAGRLPAGSMLKLYFGGRYSLVRPGRRALNFGLAPTREAIDAYLSMIEGRAIPWSVTVMGDSVLDSPIARYAVERGGHLRVGIEDVAGTSQATNREMVAAAADLARQAGRPVAGPNNVRAQLGLPAGASLKVA